MPTENYNKNHAASLDYVNTAITNAWNKMKQYITDHAIDIDTYDQILARLNTIIGHDGGGSASYSVLSEQCTYLDAFKADLSAMMNSIGIYGTSQYELIQWVSMLRMSQGVFGNYIYAIDANGYEHFYTAEEWEIMKQQLAEGEISELPNCVGGVMNNSSGAWIISYDSSMPSGQWGSYGLSIPYSGSGEAILRSVDPINAKRYYNSFDTCIVNTIAEMNAIITNGYWTEGSTQHTVSSSTQFVVMEHIGQTTVQVQDYINEGTASAPIWTAILTGDQRIGTTMDVYRATAYTNTGGTRYRVPYKDSQNQYGSPFALYCAQYKAYDDDDTQWDCPTQANLSLLCANFAAHNAMKRSVTGTNLPSGYSWSAAQNAAPYAYYVVLPSGSSSVNGKANGYLYVPFAAFRWRNA